MGTLEQRGSCLSTEHGHIATNIYSHHNHGASMAHRSAFAQSSLLHLRRPATRPTRSANALTTYFAVPFRMYQRPHTQSGGGKRVQKKGGVTEIAVLTIPHKRRPFPDAHRHFRLGESPCGDARGTPYKHKQKHAPIKREMSPSMKMERSKSSGVYDAQEKGRK